MEQPLKAVNYYKRALLHGCLHNLAADGELNLRPVDRGASSAYLSRMFDTGDSEETFNRLTVDGTFGDSRLEVIVAVADEPDMVLDGEVVAIDGYLSDPAVLPVEKARALMTLRHVRSLDCTDLLLHRLEGRYVWIYVGVYPAGEEDRELRGLRLEFPRESFTRYFPEIYREDDFFDRYIAVFQSLYLDLERRVDELPQLLDYETVSDKGLLELAGWLGLEGEGIFFPSQLRRMIADLDLYQGKKGTRAALEAVLELVCGTRPRVVERFQWETVNPASPHQALLGRLYGEEPGSFCVLLAPGETCPDRRTLDRLIQQYSPIGVPHKLVFLQKCSRMDAHCYLDSTSALAIPESARADGGTLEGFVALG